MKTKKTYTVYSVFLILASLLLFTAQWVQAFTSVSAQVASDALSSDPTAVMFDTRTVDEHNGCNPPWFTTPVCPGAATHDRTPMWTVNVENRLPISVPYWNLGSTRNTGAPEDEAEVRSIIGKLLEAGVIDFNTPIYLICRTAYRSYFMSEWMDTTTFAPGSGLDTDPGAAAFTNLINVDDDGTPGGGLGGMQEWIASGLSLYNNAGQASDYYVPPQVFSITPADGYSETITHNVTFTVNVLEPTTGGLFNYSSVPVTEVSLYVDEVQDVVDNSATTGLWTEYILQTQTALSNAGHTWNVSATNSAGPSWNLYALAAGPSTSGQRSFTVDNVPWTITATADSNGSISPSGAVDVVEGNAQVFTITPNTGYVILDVVVDGSSVGAVTTYTFTNVNTVHTINATFELDPNATTYIITATASSGGSVSPLGAVEVVEGENQAFTITPDTGYVILYVVVDDNSVGAVTTYTFSNVTSVGHKIDVTFSLIYTITATADSNGSISPSGVVTLNPDADQTFTITPDAGYRISDVWVDNNSVLDQLVADSYTFNTVVADHTIDARFTGEDNISPSKPELVFPEDEGVDLPTSLNFTWKPAKDSDSVSYDLYYCENPNFIGSALGCSGKGLASVGNKGFYYAGTGFGLLMFGLVLSGGIRNRSKIMLLLVTLIFTTGMLFVSCGSEDYKKEFDPSVGNTEQNETRNTYKTYAVSGLKEGETYYWKVVAKDDRGDAGYGGGYGGGYGEVSSEVRSFTTRLTLTE